MKQAEIIFNLSLEKENESSSSIKNSNNDAEILGNDNDNDNDNGNEEKEDDDKNDIENNLLYSNSNSKSLDAQFKQLYNDISNSNIQESFDNASGKLSNERNPFINAQKNLEISQSSSIVSEANKKKEEIIRKELLFIIIIIK